MANKGNSGRKMPQSSREKANREREREEAEKRRKEEKRQMARRETLRKKAQKDEELKEPKESDEGKKSSKPEGKKSSKPEGELPDVRKDIIDRFTNEKNWFHASHDKHLMDNVLNWVDRMEEWLGTELIEGWKILAWGLESADNAGILTEIQATTYTGNFDRKMSEILPYLWDASMEAEKWEAIIRATEELDEDLSNTETGEDFHDFTDEESEEFQNRFGM